MIRYRAAVGVDEQERSLSAELDGPAALVHRRVMLAAQEDEVIYAGRTAVGPEDDVVGVGPLQPTITAGEPAPAISQAKRFALGRGDGALGTSHVEGFGVGADDDPADLGVAGQPAYGVTAQESAVGELARPAGAGLDGLEVGQYGEVRRLATVRGQVAAVELAATQLYEGVRAALFGCALVVRPGRSGQCVDGGLHQRAIIAATEHAVDG